MEADSISLYYDEPTNIHGKKKAITPLQYQSISVKNSQLILLDPEITSVELYSVKGRKLCSFMDINGKRKFNLSRNISSGSIIVRYRKGRNVFSRIVTF